MKVSVRIEQNIREPEVVILTDRMTEEVDMPSRAGSMRAQTRGNTSFTSASMSSRRN